MVKFEGSYPEIEHLVTGFYSLDRAFVGVGVPIGIPIGHGYEIFGTNHVGKSSFVYSLAGIIAKARGENIALCDFEGFQKNLLERYLTYVGFDGTCNSILKKEDEDQLDAMLSLLEKDYAVGILDSIGAISPIAERGGDLGEANMGRRAMVLAQFARKALYMFRASKKPRTILMINHYYPKIGTRGWDTPGGEVKKFLASVRVKLQRAKEFDDGSYVLNGTVIKNRWGNQDRAFYAFMVTGHGLHHGLTALWDGIMLKKVTYEDGWVKLDGDKRRMAEYVKAAKRGNAEVFAPFYTLLENGETVETDEMEKEVEAEA